MSIKDLNIGIDVGATKIKCAVVDIKGTILKSLSMKSWKSSKLEDNIQHLMTLIDQLLGIYGQSRIYSIGMGLPGTVDDSKGMVIYTPNLQWNNLPIAKIIRDHSGIPVHIVQDTGAAVWGEYVFGAGKGLQNVVCTTIGSGVACGIIIKGELYGGTNHTAGEIGHLHIEDDDIVCGCGNTGCLEAHASGLGLVKLFHKGIQNGSKTSVLHHNILERIDAHVIFNAAKEGDEYCINTIDQMVRYLAKGLSAVATVLAPEMIIISGGLSKEIELLFMPLRKYFYEYSYHTIKENVKMELAELGSDAPLVGASALYLAPEYRDAIN